MQFLHANCAADVPGATIEPTSANKSATIDQRAINLDLAPTLIQRLQCAPFAIIKRLF